MSIFSKIKISRPRANKFDLSHERKMSMQMGYCVPMLVQEIVPGDSFRVRSEIMMRLAPMLAPIMHRVNVFTHYFFVPNRLVWEQKEWEDFITGGREGDSAPVAPFIAFNDANANELDGAVGIGSLWDYLGLPPQSSSQFTLSEINVSAIPFRAYQLIWDEYYRDQNVTASLDISKTSGAVTGAELTKLLTLRKRAWEKDYFTSALPWAQRGDEVLIPLDADIDWSEPARIFNIAGGTVTAGNVTNAGAGAGAGASVLDSDGDQVRIENIDGISNAVVTINDLRTSVQLQKWLENNARGGARYIEQILVHFGVVSSDARLQRPEYLGGGKQPVTISEVLSTAQVELSEDDLPQGNMAGHGVSVGRSNGFQRKFEEHGYVIGIVSVLPRTAYMQGVPRHFTRFDKYDYYWREFSHLGEQAVRNKELYWDPLTDPSFYSPDGTFGYQSRYAEYKYQPSTVHGQFRDTLLFWHMARFFNGEPVLNENFIMSDPTKRIFAVTDPSTEDLYVQIYNDVSAMRLMPYFGTPQFGMP